MEHQHEAGQTLLIVVLVMAVSLIVGLAVISRSVTNLHTSTDQQQSQQALSAAEAGIERALKEVTPTPGGVATLNANLGNAVANVQVTEQSGTDAFENHVQTVKEDDGIDLWLVDHNTDGTLNLSGGTWPADEGGGATETVTVYWGDKSKYPSCASLPSDTPALEIIDYTKDGVGNVASQRYAFDANTSRAASNNFTAASCSSFEQFAFEASIPNFSGYVARLVPLYNDAPIDVVASSTSFPSQGKVIQSTGTSGSTARKVTYFQGFPEIPSAFFQYALLVP